MPEQEPKPPCTEFSPTLGPKWYTVVAIFVSSPSWVLVSVGKVGLCLGRVRKEGWPIDTWAWFVSRRPERFKRPAYSRNSKGLAGQRSLETIILKLLTLTTPESHGEWLVNEPQLAALYKTLTSYEASHASVLSTSPDHYYLLRQNPKHWLVNPP